MEDCRFLMNQIISSRAILVAVSLALLVGMASAGDKFVDYTVPASSTKTMATVREYFIQMGYREDPEHIAKCSKKAGTDTLVLRRMDHAGLADADECLLVTPMPASESKTTLRVEHGARVTGLTIPTTMHDPAKKIHQQFDDAFAEICRRAAKE